MYVLTDKGNMEDDG